jgi:hypothetical protein
MTRRFFCGWVLLATAFVIITMAVGTLFTLGVFLKPIEDSMGWSRSGIRAIGFFDWVVMGPGEMVAGLVSGRLGTRRVVLVGGVLLGPGLVLSSARFPLTGVGFPAKNRPPFSRQFRHPTALPVTAFTRSRPRSRGRHPERGRSLSRSRVGTSSPRRTLPRPRRICIL